LDSVFGLASVLADSFFRVSLVFGLASLTSGLSDFSGLDDFF